MDCVCVQVYGFKVAHGTYTTCPPTKPGQTINIFQPLRVVFDLLLTDLRQQQQQQQQQQHQLEVPVVGMEWVADTQLMYTVEQEGEKNLRPVNMRSDEVVNQAGEDVCYVWVDGTHDALVDLLQRDVLLKCNEV